MSVRPLVKQNFCFGISYLVNYFDLLVANDGNTNEK